MIEQHLLCYGDSVSWGIIPGTRQRHVYEKRWPGILQALLGSKVRVIEECLNGRTTAWDDPFRPNRNGKDQLLPALQSHAPLDLVILFLGTNDMQTVYGVNAYASSLGAGVLVDTVLSCRAEPMQHPPKVLLVSPPRIVRPCGAMVEKFRGAEEKSAEFTHWYRRIADERGCGYFDAAEVVHPSVVDGVHWDEAQHQQFATAMHTHVTQLLATAKSRHLPKGIA
ncbi:SGNH/GDSL hydrolase family protein [Rhodoferax sp. AJA081-3]|uniref:SGNH/GDSL hydrolase family protein n=1 Tax=Rhodoferax sp. AJA081-3 TaxID=2752316 RepID=UPI001ADF80FB|nr:SGNH/GDSL hydrolase family protein [Rhodoferax sp. AJA081-3]QTN28253.1 SGNH/GDSL hydrolase family protein [Rhodoferax sp. AJA081-3]